MTDSGRPRSPSSSGSLDRLQVGDEVALGRLGAVEQRLIEVRQLDLRLARVALLLGHRSHPTAVASARCYRGAHERDDSAPRARGNRDRGGLRRGDRHGGHSQIGLERDRIDGERAQRRGGDGRCTTAACSSRAASAAAPGSAGAELLRPGDRHLDADRARCPAGRYYATATTLQDGRVLARGRRSSAATPPRRRCCGIRRPAAWSVTGLAERAPQRPSRDAAAERARARDGRQRQNAFASKNDRRSCTTRRAARGAPTANSDERAARGARGGAAAGRPGARRRRPQRGPSTTFTSSADLYDPATNSFTPTASMISTRSQAGFATLPDGDVLVTGGVSQSRVPAGHRALGLRQRQLVGRRRDADHRQLRARRAAAGRRGADQRGRRQQRRRSGRRRRARSRAATRRARRARCRG